MGQTIQQGAGELLGAKDAGSFVEGKVTGHDGDVALLSAG